MIFWFLRGQRERTGLSQVMLCTWLKNWCKSSYYRVVTCDAAPRRYTQE